MGAARAADLLQVTARSLWDNDKNTFAKSAAQAPAWMRATLLSIADLALGDHLG